ncbi:uncharacterized protein K489DRAFT_314936 [Dissoconium aciculare CBS 342.82]|uniref:Uncharacterized protein n=1 Tax=Dissoconium aciculare CBS 342.82 TaxID=1314786 RepID=A0A6J3MCD4_9PEZI|nr:uncharacterized protein K489DRAFT_314936 [Dissoconium aciculare CBS 342.82]KAF1825681.1 hypothetical protein K489DRAFT_314936 [Dissoconium aciculare CBS 342.82]
MATNNAPISYSATVRKGLPPQDAQNPQQVPAVTPTSQLKAHSPRQADRQPISPSPSHVPRTEHPEDAVYVLTILTDKAHHARMTSLRNKYFPPKINKLAAHLTLFHALPSSKLETTIIPSIEALVRSTNQFKIHATKPFQLKKGIAISISEQDGGKQGHAIHRDLQNRWKKDGFLSEQDAGGCRIHYTIMNKVDDEVAVSRAFGEVVGEFQGDFGTAEGLALWRYDRGFWRADRRFLFART